MAVYVDDLNMQADVPNGNHTVRGQWSHLTADTEEELHDFAKRLGLRRDWFQPQKFLPDNDHNRAKGQVGKPEGRFHYDVVKSKRAQAIKLGAVVIGIGTSQWMDLFSPEWRDDDKPLKTAVARRDVRQAAETIAELILDSWTDWSNEAELAATVDQDMTTYHAVMIERLTEVIVEVAVSVRNHGVPQLPTVTTTFERDQGEPEVI